MPKTLNDWLHYSALKWQMPGVAHRDVGGVWHRGDLPGWAECGKWLSRPFVQQSAGYRQRWRNPWAGPKSRTFTPDLCAECFADELPLLQALLAVPVESEEGNR